MKKGLCIAAVLALFAIAPATTHAHSYDSDDDGHPLRIIAHVLHPFGVLLQDFVFRPLHKHVISSDAGQYWLGHDTREEDGY